MGLTLGLEWYKGKKQPSDIPVVYIQSIGSIIAHIYIMYIFRPPATSLAPPGQLLCNQLIT